MRGGGQQRTLPTAQLRKAVDRHFRGACDEAEHRRLHLVIPTSECRPEPRHRWRVRIVPAAERAVSTDHPARGETVVVFGDAPALVDGVSSPVLEVDLRHSVHGQLQLVRLDAQRTQDALLASTEAERNALLPQPARAFTVSPTALRKQTGKGLGVRGLGYGIVDLGLVPNLCTVHRDDATAHLHPLFRRLHRATEPLEDSGGRGG